MKKEKILFVIKYFHGIIFSLDITGGKNSSQSVNYIIKFITFLIFFNSSMMFEMYSVRSNIDD